MGKVVSVSMGKSGFARPSAPAPTGSKPVKPVATRPGTSKTTMTGIAKARSVGGNAYAKGQTKIRKNPVMGLRKR